MGTFDQAGFVYDIGGVDRHWHGKGPIEVRVSTGGTGWEWRIISDKERAALINALNDRRAYPSRAAMEAAVNLEIEACIGRVTTQRIGEIVQQAIDAATSSDVGRNQA